jgi:hypothetical protein
MTKNKKLFFGAFGLIALGSYLVYRYSVKTKKGEKLTYTESVKEDVKDATSTIVNTVLPVASYPLKKGSKGSNVVVLQRWLNNNGYAEPKLVTDGIFGAKTESAVRNMQEYANQKVIADYVVNNLFNTNFAYGQVSQDFFTKFVK